MKYPDQFTAEYRQDPQRVVIVGGAMMLLLLMMPLLFWMEDQLRGQDQVPECDSLPVLSQLRVVYPKVTHTPLTEVLRDVQSIGLDRGLGHRICYARVGDGKAARNLRYAVSYQDDANDSVRIELVTD